MITLSLSLTACNNSNGETSSVYEISLGIFVYSSSKFRDIFFFYAKSNCHRVTTIFCQQISTFKNSVAQLRSFDTSTRTARFSIFGRNYNNRLSYSFCHSRRGNSYNSVMPIFSPISPIILVFILRNFL